MFGSSKRRAQAYLAANGRRKLQEICDHIGATKNNVSPMLSALEADGILGFLLEGSEKYYLRKLDRTVGISNYLTAKFHLTNDGLDV